MTFCTAINCMDGRVQLPVIAFLMERFGVDYIDMISEPGPNLILAGRKNVYLIQSIFDRLNLSLDRHHSVGVAIVGHHDCAGNPAPKQDQVLHLKESAVALGRRFQRIEIIGLWVDENLKAMEIDL